MMRLFVAGYARETAKADLLQLFARFGTAAEDITFPRDRRSRRKKGYAYINVTDVTAAEAAIRELDGTAIVGRTLTVVRAEERPVKKRGS